MIPPDFIGTLPGWATFVTVVSLGLRWEILRRRAATAHLAVIVDRETAEHAADLSAGGLFATEVDNLRTRLDKQSEKFEAKMSEMEDRHSKAMATAEDRHQEAARAAEKRHEECLSDRENLRGEVSILRDEINGMVRVITQASIDRVVLLGDVVPADIKDAAARAQIQIDKAAQESKDEH